MRAQNDTGFCPDPALPELETEIRPGYQGEPRNLEWWVQRELKCPIPPGSLVGKFIEFRRNPGPAPTDAGEALHRTRLEHGLKIADWSVRVLYAAQQDPRYHVKVSVDATFLTKELLGVDNPDAAYQQPNSITTLYTAARLVAGGRLVLIRRTLRAKSAGAIEITGNGKGGYDIFYDSPMGPMTVECKQRSFEAGLRDTPPDQSRYVVHKIAEASPKLPHKKGARILVIGFQTGAAPLVLSQQQAEMYQRAVFNEFLKTNDPDWPDCIIVEHADAWHPLPVRLDLKNREEFQAVRPILLAAMPAREVVMVGEFVNGRIVPRPWIFQLAGEDR